MSGAGAALQQAAADALRELPEASGIYLGRPVQAALPYVVVESGPETDWGHKSGAGREIRLGITSFDGGERPERLQRLMAEVESKIERLATTGSGWALVSFCFVRSSVVRQPRGGGWAGAIDYRARMLKTTEA